MTNMFNVVAGPDGREASLGSDVNTGRYFSYTEVCIVISMATRQNNYIQQSLSQFNFFLFHQFLLLQNA